MQKRKLVYWSKHTHTQLLLWPGLAWLLCVCVSFSQNSASRSWRSSSKLVTRTIKHATRTASVYIIFNSALNPYIDIASNGRSFRSSTVCGNCFKKSLTTDKPSERKREKQRIEYTKKKVQNNVKWHYRISLCVCVFFSSSFSTSFLSIFRETRSLFCRARNIFSSKKRWMKKKNGNCTYAGEKEQNCWGIGAKSKEFFF